jgi:hypothetical protein
MNVCRTFDAIPASGGRIKGRTYVGTLMGGLIVAEPTCGECRSFHPVPGATGPMGQCRRFPPGLVPLGLVEGEAGLVASRARWTFPYLPADHPCCDEFFPRSELKSCPVENQ